MTNEQRTRWANAFRFIRWGIAIGGLLIFTGLLLKGSFEICKVETATDKDRTTVTNTCDPPTVTDASVVAIALLIGLLFAPEMSEVGIFGVSLKRRVEAAESKASQSEAKAERLETQLQMQNVRVDTLTQNVAAASAQGIGNLYIMSGEKLDNVDSGLREKAERFSRGEMPVSTAGAFQLREDLRPDPTLVSRIIQNWEILAASLDLPPYRPDRDVIPRAAVTAADAKRFRNVFAEELQIVRAARNTAAHFGPISNDELQTALDISEQLLEILRRNPPSDPVGAVPVS